MLSHHHLRTGAILLLALSVAGCSLSTRQSPPLAPADPGGTPALAIPLPDYAPELQGQLATEIREAPPGAVWPRVVGDYSQTRRAVCAVTPNQAACRRICAAESNAPAFCTRANVPGGS